MGNILSFFFPPAKELMAPQVIKEAWEVREAREVVVEDREAREVREVEVGRLEHIFICTYIIIDLKGTAA